MAKTAHLPTVLTVLAVLFLLQQSAAGQQEAVAERDRLVAEIDTLLKNQSYAEAIRSAQRVLEIQGQMAGENNDLFATYLQGLGNIYSMIHEYDESEPLYRKALAIQKQLHGTDSLEFATALNALGTNYDGMELYDLAESHLSDALRIRESKLPPADPRYRESLYNLGSVLGALGQYDQAERLLLKLLEIDKSDRGRSDADYLMHLRILAQVYFLHTQYGSAEPLMREVIQIDYRHSNEAPSDLAVIQRIEDEDKLGLIYLYLGRYKEAESSLLQAKKEWQTASLETKYVQSSVYTHLGLLYQSENRTKEALDELSAALGGQQADIENGIYGLRAYIEAIHFSLDALVNVAAESRDDAAIRLAFDWTLRRKALGLDVGIAVSRVEPYYSDERDIYERVDQIGELSSQIHRLTFSPPADANSDDVQREVAVLRFAIIRLQDELDRKFTPAIKWNLIDVSSVRSFLPSGSALIDFLVVPRLDFKARGNGKHWVSHYFAFVFSSDGDSRPRLIDVGNTDAIDRQIEEIRGRISEFKGLTNEKQAESEYQRVSGDLHDVLFQKSGLKRALGSATRIYVSPDGELTRIAFEALNDKQRQGRYLAEDYNFIYLPAARKLPAIMQPQQKHSAQLGPGTVVFAAPDYNLKESDRKARAFKLLDHPEQLVEAEAVATPAPSGTRVIWEPLNGAMKEAKDAKTALQGSPYAPVAVYQGPNALQEVFRHIHGPRVVHVATHGYFLPSLKLGGQDTDSGGGFTGTLGRAQRSDDPLQRSGLVFAGANLVEDLDPHDPVDGWMTARDVAHMDLTGTDLVVLSACDTGLADVKVGAGVQGLQQAFLGVGAQALIMTLYETPDDDQLMTVFYHLLAAGEDKATALHKAQLSIIHDRQKVGGAAHPYYWGSFIFVD
jgi:CHAT domain-containing protein/tetratricopeptide (TPR) repeat protein